MLKPAEPGATFLLNSPFGPDEVWDQLPRAVQQQIIDKKLKFYVIDGYEVAKRHRHGRPHQHHHADLLLRHQRRPAARRGHRRHQVRHQEDLRQARRNGRPEELRRGGCSPQPPARSQGARQGHRTLRYPSAGPRRRARLRAATSLARIIAGDGDDLPVSAMPIDGTFPTGTAQWEKRNIALEIPVWDEELCIQCGKCVLVCPHAVIRAKVYDDSYLGDAPAGFKAVPARWKDMKDRKYTLQVAPEDCTGCALCVEVCPAKNKSEVKHRAINMAPQPPLREAEAANWDFFLKHSRNRPQAALAQPGEGHPVAPSRSSSSPAPAPAAARRRTSS